MKIPVFEPHIGGREIDYVTECLRSGWISSAGPAVDRFEREWAAYCGRAHGVAVSSGTAALQIAVRALGLGPGDEVLIPAFTIISCALAVIYAGATPVLVDVDPRTWTIDTNVIESRLTDKTRAMLAVHIYGHPANVDRLVDAAQKHELAIIEDAAEAHGAEYLVNHGSANAEWRRCGSFGAVSCFSFYANKLVTTGEGGMILTDDAEVAEKARSLRNLCFVPGRRFEHDDLGHNFRLTSVQAAIGLAQIERMPDVVENKRRVAREYSHRLSDCASVILPVEEPWARSVYWVYGILLKDRRCDAVLLARHLADLGIETRPFFLGLHEQPALRDRGLFRGETYPVTEELSRQGLYLPSATSLTTHEIALVCDALKESLS